MKRTWDTERAKRLLKEGHTPAEVAEMVGVAVPTIARFKSEDTTAEVNLHFVLNDEEVYLRAKTADRGAEILKNLSWLLEMGGAAKWQ